MGNNVFSSNNLLESLRQLAGIIDREKKRLVINTAYFEKYKNQLNKIEQQYLVKICVNDLVPDGNVFIMASESDIGREILKISDPIIRDCESLKILPGWRI